MPAVPAVPAVPETKRAIPKPVPKLTANPETLLTIDENASFKKFAELRVPSRKDKYTAMSRRHLIGALGGDRGNDIQRETEQLWQEFNDTEAVQIEFGKVLFDVVLKWHLRGLTLKAAVRKVRVDREIRRRSHAERRSAAEAEEIAIAFEIFTESGP